MQPIKLVHGRGVALYQADIDTDAILPKQFLRRIDRTGFGEFLFFEWKKNPDFALSRASTKGARILIAGRNFGCGSSREHAVWALRSGGFEAVVAPSFGDIFANNGSKNGLVLVTLPESTCRKLAICVEQQSQLEINIDIERQELTAGMFKAKFELPGRIRRLLLEGQDEIGLTLAREAEIAAFEAQRPTWMPVVAAAISR